MILYQDSNFGLSKLVEDQIFESVSKSKSCQLGRAHSQINKHQNPLMGKKLNFQPFWMDSWGCCR